MRNSNLGLQKRSSNLKRALTTLLVILILPFLAVFTLAHQSGTDGTGTVTGNNHSNSDDEIVFMTNHDNEVTSSFLEKNEFSLQFGSWYFEGKYGFSETDNLGQDVHGINRISSNDNQLTHLSEGNSVRGTATMMFLGLGLFIVASVAKKRLKLNY